MRMMIIAIAGAILLAAPANAHFPSKCASELNFIAVDGMMTQKWKSENVSSKTKELLTTPDTVRLKSWAVDVDANQQYLMQTILPALGNLLRCIADSAEGE